MSFCARQIYEHLQDEESKKIFLHRMNYSVTGDDSHLRKMVQMCPESRQFYSIPKQKAYIFGAGTYGGKTKRFFDMEWMGFIDNNNQK